MINREITEIHRLREIERLVRAAERRYEDPRFYTPEFNPQGIILISPRVFQMVSEYHSGTT